MAIVTVNVPDRRIMTHVIEISTVNSGTNYQRSAIQYTQSGFQPVCIKHQDKSDIHRLLTCIPSDRSAKTAALDKAFQTETSSRHDLTSRLAIEK